MDLTDHPGTPNHGPQGSPLRRLTPAQIELIDAFLVAVGEYGEVHLIVQRGELKYINKVESHRAWKDRDGSGS